MGLCNGKPKLSDKDRDYIAHQTSLPTSDVEKMFETFLENNPNGKIRRENFSPELRSMYSPQNLEKLENLVFSTFDTNNDGCIDYKEFMVIFHLLRDGSPEEKSLRIFQLCDIFKDGTVSYAELCYLFSFIKPDLPNKIMEEREKILSFRVSNKSILTRDHVSIRLHYSK